MSFKITPYYGLTSNWEQQSFIGQGFVTQVPVGRYQNYGVEAAFTKGDFSRDGFSGQLAFTYTHAYTQYQAGIVPNQVSTLNAAIKNYNAMTKAGGGAQCYQLQLNGSDVPVACNAAPIYSTSTGGKKTLYSTPILNPYYNQPQQGLQDTNGWYPGTIYQLQPVLGPGYGIYSQGYASPYATSLILNYRSHKLAVTPSFQWLAGTYYGSPMDVAGVDPRSCAINQGTTGVATTNNPLDCDYRTLKSAGAAPRFGYLYIPNPIIGSFATIGQFQEPNLALMNMQISYDVTPKLKLQATLTNIFHTCWGGSSNGTSAVYGAGSVYCGYYTNAAYVGSQPGAGWFNGSSPHDTKANGFNPYAWETLPFAPIVNNGVGTYFPFNAYFSAQIKI